MEHCPLCGHQYSIYEGIFIDEEHHIAIIDGKVIRLSHRTSQFFAGLVKCSPRIATKAYLMDYVYGLEADNEPDQKIVDLYIMRIRRKIKHTRFRVATIWGEGFKLTEISDGENKQAA